MKGFPLIPLTGTIAAFVAVALLTGAGRLAHGRERKETTPAPAAESKLETAVKPEEAETEEEDGPETPGEPGDSMPAGAGESQRGGISLPARERLDMMLPPGRTHTGVRFPEYLTVAPDPENIDPVTGVPAATAAPLTSLFETEVMTRLDEDHVRVEQALWQRFDAETGGGEPGMKVELQSGIYNLKNGLLVSSRPVRIENETFRLDGNAMLHDRASGLTRLTGEVRLRFFETEKSGKAPAAGVDPAEPEPVAAPNPEN